MKITKTCKLIPIPEVAPSDEPPLSRLCQPLAAHGGAEADEAQRARHDDGNPARPERHIDAIQGDGPPHHNPDQLQKRDQGKDAGGKRAKGSCGHCSSPMTHEDARPPQPKWGGIGPAATPESFSMCRIIAVSRTRPWRQITSRAGERWLPSSRF